MQNVAQIGHNSASVGQMVTDDPSVIYRDDSTLPALVLEIKSEIAAHTPDLSTRAGREAIASLAYSISRRKTPIIKAGASLTEDWRKRTTAVNALKSKIEKEFDALRDEARADLDAWENKEKERAARIDGVVAFLQSAGAVQPGQTVAEIDCAIAKVSEVLISDDYGDSLDRVTQEKVAALAALASARASTLKADEDRAELDRLRAEAAERARVALQAENQRIAQEAEQARLQAAERRAAEAAEAKVREAADAEIQIERQKAQEAANALADEQRRQRELAAAEAAKAAADARRQADVDHRGAVMRSAKEALMEHAGVSEAIAKKVVMAIVAGQIPSVTLTF